MEDAEDAQIGSRWLHGIDDEIWLHTRDADIGAELRTGRADLREIG
jgi:hypothetical protein